MIQNQQGMVLLPMIMFLLSVMLLLFGAQQQDLSARQLLFHDAQQIQQAEIVAENGLASGLNQYWAMTSGWQCQLTEEKAQLCLKGLSGNLALLCSAVRAGTKAAYILRFLYVEPALVPERGIRLKRLPSGWRDFAVPGEEHGCESHGL